MLTLAMKNLLLVIDQFNFRRNRAFMFAILAVSAVLIGACAPHTTPTSPSIPPTQIPQFPARDYDATLAPISSWQRVLSHTPYPYSTSLPPPKRTSLDGVYALFDPGEPQWWNCRRCPDYLPAGGNWRLQYDRGVMRIFYTVTGWVSMASYTVEGDRLYLFNDPTCIYDVGIYTWQIERGQLTLREVEDECAIRLRANNLTRPGWLSCQLPEGQPTDTWVKPAGCTDEP